jgi:hypothetical protein
MTSMTGTGARVAHQVRLLGRSARHLGARPSDGKEFPRLLRSGIRSTMALRTPWLPFRAIDELARHVEEGSRVLEFGGGGSTLWFLDRGAELVTVEDHPGWARVLRDEVGDASRWTLLDGTPGVDYSSAAGRYAAGWFDVVLVDGKDRPECVRAAAPKVRPGGLLLVDDVDRAEYSSAIGDLGWPRVDIVGFAPAKPSLGYTAFLTKP